MECWLGLLLVVSCLSQYASGSTTPIPAPTTSEPDPTTIQTPSSPDDGTDSTTTTATTPATTTTTTITTTSAIDSTTTTSAATDTTTTNATENEMNTTRSIMCYQCADSSDESGKNDCQTYYRTMRKYRRLFETKNQIIPGKYVKNCTLSNVNETEVHCMITRVEINGGIRSFIRGCTNGVEYGVTIEGLRGLNKLPPDNQTSCAYTGQGYLVCVTVCGEDFCNGPLASGPHVTLSASCAFAALFVFSIRRFWWV